MLPELGVQVQVNKVPVHIGCQCNIGVVVIADLLGERSVAQVGSREYGNHEIDGVAGHIRWQQAAAGM